MRSMLSWRLFAPRRLFSNLLNFMGLAALGALILTIPCKAQTAPNITQITPTLGGVGAAFYIYGSNFGSTQGSSAVTFNGTAATVTNWSSANIVTTVPSGATTGPVVVTVNGVASNGVTFTVNTTPNLWQISPTSGGVGAALYLYGSNFGSTQGSSTVTINGTAATVTSWSNTNLAATVPSGAATGPVVVTVNGVASNGIGFTVPPTSPSISSVSPGSGTAGNSVTIIGTNFGASQGTSTVTFGNVVASISNWSSTSITAQVPDDAPPGVVQIIVATSAGSSTPASFAVVPSIAQLSPALGPSGTSVTISGANFGASQGNGTVTFNGTTATVASWSDDDVYAVVPANATTGPVLIVAGGAQSNPATFTITTGPPLEISSPASGTVVNPGQSVSISVTSPADVAFSQVGVVGEDPVGFSSIAGSVPANFSMTIPAVTALRSYTLNADGVTVSGELVESATVSIDIERPDSPTSLAPLLPQITFEAQGERSSTAFLATFADGSIYDVTNSSNTSFQSSAASVATVDNSGTIAGGTTGTAWITADYNAGGQLTTAAVKVTVLSPLLAASPTSIAFGSQTVGTSSAPQPLTLTNQTSTSMSILSIQTAGDFAETNDCTSSPLPAGGTCTINMTFTPAVAAAEAGSVIITNNLQAAATTVPLDGSGAAP